LYSNVCSGIVVGMAGGPTSAAEVLDLVARARDACGRLDPVAVSLAEVPAVFDAVAELERLAGGAVLRLAARYEEAGVWKRNGARSPEEDLARKTGTGTSRARRKLGTSKRLRSQPRTDDAVRRGGLSPDQADEVSEGAGAAPDAEDDLLDTAQKRPLHDLRRKVAEERAKADRDREERARRLHKARSVRRWDDADGMGNLLLRLPAEQMREVDAALKPRIDRTFADARDAGRMEPVEAYTADVVRDLLLSRPDGGGSTGSSSSGRQAVRPDKKVIARIDVEALNRGRVEGDEICEIAGVGPVAVSAVRRLLSDAFLTLVIERATTWSTSPTSAARSPPASAPHSKPAAPAANAADPPTCSTSTTTKAGPSPTTPASRTCPGPAGTATTSRPATTSSSAATPATAGSPPERPANHGEDPPAPAHPTTSEPPADQPPPLTHPPVTSTHQTASNPRAPTRPNKATCSPSPTEPPAGVPGDPSRSRARCCAPDRQSRP
jgi:hypothetical protein